MKKIGHYEELFDYLSAPDMPTSPEDAIVFGRNDPRVAHALGDLAFRGLTDLIVITGNIGKDSGYLKDYGIPESDLLAEIAMREHGVPASQIRLEQKAKNGAENAQNSLSIIANEHPDTKSVTAVAHATSLRRLAEGVRHEVAVAGSGPSRIHRVPSDYKFNPNNPTDQAEAEAEMLRLADWPEKGWLQPQADLPKDLVEFARTQAEARKKST